MNDFDDCDNLICHIYNLIEHKTKEQRTRSIFNFVQTFLIFANTIRHVS